MPYRVFISYSTHDLSIVTYLRNALSGLGCEIFVAEYDVKPGERLTDKVVASIHESDLFLLLWSHHSKNSEYVLQEVGAAKGTNCRIIPIVLQQGLHPPAMTADLKYLPLYKNPQKALAWLREHVFHETTAKNAREGLIALAIVGFLGWFLSSKT